MNAFQTLATAFQPKRPAPSRRQHAPALPSIDAGMALRLRAIFLEDDLLQALSYPEAAGPQAIHPKAVVARRFFLRGDAVAIDRVADALGADDLGALIRSSLVLEDQGFVQCRLKVQGYQGLILLSDFFSERRSPDFVLEVGPAGRYLANLTVRAPVASALDLGCGCGIQALLAARHCDHVVATDINPRALVLTRLNAELNGIVNIEVLQGSYFEPIEARRFDLIVANLPYVIAPDRESIYRTNDLPGDRRLRGLIGEFPRHLNEGGFAHLLANWIHGADQPWWQPMFEASSVGGADAWLIYNGSKDAHSYAAMWIDDDPKDSPRAYARAEQSWARWYRQERIERIAMGALNLRRRATRSNWICAAPVKSTLETPAGDQVQRLFANQDRLSALQGPEELLSQSLNVEPIETSVSRDGRRARVHSMKGLGLEADVDARCLPILRHLREGPSLRSAMEQAAQDRLAVEDGSREVRLADLRRLLDLGLLSLA